MTHKPKKEKKTKGYEKLAMGNFQKWLTNFDKGKVLKIAASGTFFLAVIETNEL